MTGGPRTSLALDDLLASAPGDWAIAAPPGSDPHRWLALLTTGLRDDARLSAYGQYLTRIDLLRRARAVRELTEAAVNDRSDGPPGPVLVIGGLPRTATTLLHTLAAGSDDVWVPRSWEYDRPGLIGTATERERRVAEAESAERLAGFARIAPDFGAIHPMAATAPEECDEVLAHCFDSFRMLIQYDLPTYRAEWLASDHSHAYALLATALRRVDQTDAPGATRRLRVLKAPGHLHAYETLRRHLPGAVVVQIHRPVSEQLPSWVDLIGSTRSAFSTAVAPRDQLLAEWLAVFSAMVDRGLAARDASPSGWIGLHYDDLVADPGRVWLGVLETVTRSTLGGGATEVDVLEAPPSRAYDRSLPHSMAPAIEDLDQRYRHLVFGD